MNQKQKNTLMTALIYFVIFAAYNLIVFMVFKTFNAVFWLSYSFMIAAFLLHILCVFFICKNLSVKAVFFGIPLFSFSIYFVCAELFCSMVFMFFQNRASVKVAILIQALLLCVFIIVAIFSIMARDTVQNVDDKIRENVYFIKGLNIDVEILIQKSTNVQVTEALKRLSETIKYSDPITNRMVAVEEQMIMQCMAELKNTFDTGDMMKVTELCRKIETLFIERNKKLMLAK